MKKMKNIIVYLKKCVNKSLKKRKNSMKKAKDTEEIADLQKTAKEGSRYEKTIELSNKWENKEASEILLKRLKIEPNDHEALEMVSMVLWKMGEHNRALFYINKIIRINKKRNSPNLQGDYIEKAIILERTWDYLWAINYYKKVIEREYQREDQTRKEQFEQNKTRPKKRVECLKEVIEMKKKSKYDMTYRQYTFN